MVLLVVKVLLTILTVLMSRALNEMLGESLICRKVFVTVVAYVVLAGVGSMLI